MRALRWRALHPRCIATDTAVGLTFVYAAERHRGEPRRRLGSELHTTRRAIHELGGPLPDDDAAAAQAWCSTSSAIRETPREVYRAGDEFEILFDNRTLHVTIATGHVVDEEQQPRFFLRAANWLHLNRGKKAWTYFADAYAVGLLFLAISGMFMLAGKKGFFGRGIFFVAPASRSRSRISSSPAGEWSAGPLRCVSGVGQGSRGRESTMARAWA